MAVWQEIFDDLRMKSLRTEVDELQRLQEIYDQLNPGEREHWDKLFLELCQTSDEQRRRDLIDKLVENDYYKSVRHSLDRAETNLEALKLLKSGRFLHN